MFNDEDRVDEEGRDECEYIPSFRGPAAKGTNDLRSAR